jgi:hypothetical protein
MPRLRARLWQPVAGDAPGAAEIGAIDEEFSWIGLNHTGLYTAAYG